MRGCHSYLLALFWGCLALVMTQALSRYSTEENPLVQLMKSCLFIIHWELVCLRFVDKRFIAGFKRVLSQLLMLSLTLSSFCSLLSHFSLPLLLSSPSSSYHLSSPCISLLNPLSVGRCGLTNGLRCDAVHSCSSAVSVTCQLGRPCLWNAWSMCVRPACDR